MGSKTFDNQSFAWHTGYLYATDHFTAISHKGTKVHPKRVEKVDGQIFAYFD